MRFQNQTSVDQQLAWLDTVNRRRTIIRPGAVVEGEEYKAWCRPAGPLTALLDDEAPHRRMFRRLDETNVRQDLLPFFERSLRRLTKATQASGLRWATLAVKIFDNDSLFDRFFDRRALATIVNTTDPSDSVAIIVGRLTEARVLRSTPPNPMEDKPKTAAIMGRGIFERWRPTARTVITDEPRVEEGFTDEPRKASNHHGAEDSGIALEQWRDLFVHRDAVEDSLARAIFLFVEGK